MSGNYERLGILSLEEVMPLVGDGAKGIFFDQPVKLNSKRLKCYKQKGTKCVGCGIEGNIFAMERHVYTDTNKYHLNLYCHIPERGYYNIMITIDHIFPRSLGGSNRMSNLQPMCANCNNKKGDEIKKYADPDESVADIKSIKEKNRKKRMRKRTNRINRLRKKYKKEQAKNNSVQS